MSTNAFIKKDVYPQVFVNPKLEHMNVNQRLYYSNKVLKHIETQEEKNGELEKAQGELFCEFNNLTLKNKRLMSDFYQHVSKQANFTDWITQKVKEQATLHSELVDKQNSQSHEIHSIAQNVSSLSSTQTNQANQLTSQNQELKKVKENVTSLDELQAKYSKQLSENIVQTDDLKNQVIQQDKDNETLFQEQKNLNRLLSTQQKQIDDHYHVLSNQIDEQNRFVKSELDKHRNVHDQLNQQLANQDKINEDADQQFNKLNDQLLVQNKINEEVTSSLHDHEQKIINFLDRMSQQEALYQLLHAKLLDVDEHHNQLYQLLNEHETSMTKIDQHLLGHDHVHKNLYEELFFQKEELLYQVKKYEDMYNDLHTNMKKKIKALKRHITKTVALNIAMFNSSTEQKTQYDLSTSANEDDKKYGELIQKLNDQVKENVDLKRELGKTNYNGPFVELFKGLPSNFPINSILINGKNVDVTRFLNISSEGSIAHFTDELQVKTFDCNKIDGVHWGKETLDVEPKDYN